jgi:hypothetical protein
MAFTVEDLINQARDIVQDTGMEFDYEDPDRHTDTKMIRFLNTALADAYRLRPDLFFPGVFDRSTLPVYTVTDITNQTPFPVDVTYFSVFVDYVAGYIGLADDEFAQDGRAVALLNRFVQKLTAKGA